jgi:very-short-patch-repair endonuclease
VRVAGDGLALPAPSWTAFQLATAAGLTWPGAVASHFTAAALHGLPVPTDQLADVITDKGHRSRRSIRAHALRLRADEVVRLPNGLALTGLQRTATDCLAALPPDRALDLWAWLSSRRILSHDELVELIGARRGSPGTGRLRELARITRSGAVSRAELRLHALLDEAGITGWVAGATVRDQHGVIGVVDLLFPEARVVVEVDGWRTHCSPEAFVADRRRQNRLVQAGFLVLRFAWTDLVQRPAEVVSQLRDVAARPPVRLTRRSDPGAGSDRRDGGP